MDPAFRPMFRALEMHKVDEGDQRGLVLLDPLGITETQTFVPEGLVPVLAMFDGERTVADIQREVRRQEPRAPADFVTNLVQQLDGHLLLRSPRFEQALTTSVKTFAALDARPAAHAGSAGYPADPDRLQQALASMVRPTVKPERQSPRALVAPHIDLARGREGYALCYGYLAECEPADLYVIFGTGHQGPSAPLTGLPLDWDTPLGRVPTDRAFLDAVHRRIGEPKPLDLWLHRREHSIEFQVLLLRHVLGDRPFSVAGFLTGHLESTDAAEIRQALDEIRAQAQASGKRVCFIAGADMAHVGPHFGDDDPVDSDRLAQLALADRAHLAQLERGDPVAFHASIESSGNPDRICGTAPMYWAAALAGGEGTLLHYGQALHGDRSQVVTFCSMVF